ncbi:MAG: hypothetical protein WD802_09290 [Gemmatimonadaceae bacterium]
MNRILPWTALALAISVSGARPSVAQVGAIQPVLASPEAGLDDPASYQGYQTRFYRDAKGNVVQVYLDARSGRVVNLLGDAVNESVGFTVRDASGRPVRLEWGSSGAVTSQSGTRRTIEYQLSVNAPRVEIGWILLGSMRVERDLQYSGRHTEKFAAPTFRQRELEELIANVERLPPPERERHLQLLNAGYVSDLSARLEPDVITTLSGGPGWPTRAAVATQAALDGKTNLQLELAGTNDAFIVVTWPTVSVRARGGRPIRFTVRVTTDAPALTPLSREQIFNAEFVRFLASARAAADRITSRPPGTVRSAADSATVTRYRRLERDARGLELVSSREKLMAGLPNYATYFGRDMMMSALMMEPIWSASMPEHVIASVLRKLGPNGDVSHEEALGGQAIRENAAEYNTLIAGYLRQTQRAAGATQLARARAILADLQKVRENYNMLDDEFQLPVLTARYLANPAIPSARKLAFMLDSTEGGQPRVALLMRELGLVARLAEPYARDPLVQNLVASPRADTTRWRSVSWRDSGAGYANGRFAMDINAIWVPRALESLAEILTRLRSIGLSQARLTALTAGAPQMALAAFARDSALLRRALDNWNGAERHFVVTLPADEVRSKLQLKLPSLPALERANWEGVLTRTGADRQPLEFLALSLDTTGRPIQVVNTDPATALFLADRTPQNAASRARAMRDVRAVMRPYPVGLLIDRLGPVVANDAYASPEVWEAFRRDLYHSPRVVWGREVNLITLGLAKQISSLVDGAGRARDPSLASHVTELRDALRRITTATEASGLKHNELWSYEIEGSASSPRLKPIRYGASTDIQLWNVTDLAVQFVLARLAPPLN